MNLSKAITSRYGNEEQKDSKVERSTMTVKEVSKYLGVSTDLTYKLCRKKQIPFIRIGSRILFKKVSVDSWLEELEYIPK